MAHEELAKRHGILLSVMEFCNQSWNFTNFARELYQICMFFATAMKLNIDVESLHFPTFLRKATRMQN